jgi:hypothetical protein
MATVEELKEMIVELKVDLAEAHIPRGHCPYSYYPSMAHDEDCDDCDKCRREFLHKYERIVRAKVAKL